MNYSVPISVIAFATVYLTINFQKGEEWTISKIGGGKKGWKIGGDEK